jgi:beta-phosphoglucomutase-like phosphatase (HAD superfamily)
LRSIADANRGQTLDALSMQELDTAAFRWHEALDAASRALGANVKSLSPPEMRAQRQELALEQREIPAVLAGLAAMLGLDDEPWLPRGPVTPRMLGLEPGARACIFDLDGVLTDSDALHAAAWAETLDPLLQSMAHTTPWSLAPFDTETDYVLYFDGRTRLDGIRLFLQSRGLHLPDLAVEAIARRKGELLEGRLAHRGIAASANARRFLQAAGYAHLGRAVVSASTTALPMLEAAHLAQLVEVRIDADTIRAEHLHPRPSPDLLLAACAELGVASGNAVSLTHSGAGIVACQAIGMPAVGIASGEEAERLRDYGAERVLPSLSGLLAPELRAAA